MYFGLVVDVDLVQNKLVRLEFEIKLEPLLLTCPFLLLLLRFVKFFWLRLVLETWNLVHTLRGSILSFFAKRIFWFDLHLYLYLMVWLEIGHLHISAKRLQTWYTPWGVHTSIFGKTFFWFDLNLYLYLMVWLEIGHLLTVEPYLHWGLLLLNTDRVIPTHFYFLGKIFVPNLFFHSHWFHNTILLYDHQSNSLASCC